MGATFEKTSDFILDSLESVFVDGGKQPAGTTTEASEGNSWFRTEETIQVHYLGQGITQFQSNAETALAGTDITWVGGAATLAGTVVPDEYEILRNTLMQEVPGTDIWRETVVYRRLSAWRELPILSAATFTTDQFIAQV